LIDISWASAITDRLLSQGLLQKGYPASVSY